MNPIRLESLRARAHPEGHRIDLSWELPETFRDRTVYVRILRRTDGFATRAAGDRRRAGLSAGARLSDTSDRHFVDRDLRGETTYYYTLLPYQAGEDPARQYDPHNRVSTLATASYDYGRTLYEYLPAIYRRYDTANGGVLERYLEICGAGLDRIHSLSRAVRFLNDTKRTPAGVLPLLADRIGWQTNFRSGAARQRNDLRDAPALFQGIGTAPAIDAVVRRMVGWNSQTREFAQNVFVSNQPQRMNLWHSRRDSDGEWHFETRPVSREDASAEGGRACAVRDAHDRLWLLYHGQRRRQWDVFVRLRERDGSWRPGVPLDLPDGLTRHPVAAMRAREQSDATLWIFWDTLEPAASRWRIQYRIGLDKQTRDLIFESDAYTPRGARQEPTEIERRRPAAAEDGSGGFYLFWQERDPVRSGWRCRYARFAAGDESPEPRDFPLFENRQPRVETDLFALFAGGYLRLYWSRRARTTRRFEIAWRDLDLESGEWGAVQILSPDRTLAPYDDREPAGLVTEDGRVELYFASNRDRGWAIWSLGANDELQRVTDASFARRAPLPLRDGDGVRLWYRSDESIEHLAESRGARTLDLRYSGSLTVDVGARPRNALRGSYYDTRRYTYHTGKANDDWYSFGTVGIFLRPTTDDTILIARNQQLLRNVLRQFLPIHLRPVFIVEPAPHVEWVYDYDRPDAAQPRVIGERYRDETDDRFADRYEGGPTDQAHDRVADWTWLRAWSREAPDHRTTDFKQTPVDLSFRVWHTAVRPGPDETPRENAPDDSPEPDLKHERGTSNDAS